MSTLLNLAYYDLKSKFSGRVLGATWLFIKPLMTILVMWLVFSYGFKTPPVDKADFSVWLTLGMGVWLFSVDAINAMTSSIVSYSYLLKNSSVRAIYLPIIKLISTSIAYVPVLIFLFFLLSAKVDFDVVMFFLMVVFLFFLILLILSLGIFLSAMRVFISDVEDLVYSLLQVGFWLTPIIWNVKLLPENFVFFVTLNPFSYVIEGLRSVTANGSYDFTFSDMFAFSALLFFLGMSLTIYRKVRLKFGDFL